LDPDSHLITSGGPRHPPKPLDIVPQYRTIETDEDKESIAELEAARGALR
jgi:hypothetical protein